MTTLLASSARTPMPARRIVKAAIMLLLALPFATFAQDNPKSAPESVEVIHLATNTRRDAMNDILSTLRNAIGPKPRIYLTLEQPAIVIRGTANDLEEAHKILAELDRPLATYRITYSITQIEDSKRSNAQHYTLITTAGNRADLRQGIRVPVITGMLDDKSVVSNSQVSYIDVGLSIGARLEGSSLSTKIEQSAIADEKSNVGIQDPIIRQSTFENTSTVTPAKPLVIGTFDMPGSPHRQEVEVLVERIP
jgi:hypothetical protein